MYQQGMSLSLKKIKKKMLLSEHKNGKEKKKAAKHCNYSDISNKLEQFSSPWTRPKKDPSKNAYRNLMMNSQSINMKT